MPKVSSLLFILLFCLLILFWVKSGEGRRYPPGILINTAPEQLDMSEAKVWKKDEYKLKALAKYKIQARVLSTYHYHFPEAGADISPVDLAVGWGIMSDQKVLDKILPCSFQNNRAWLIKICSPLNISIYSIMSSSAHMHIIPKDKNMKALIQKLRKGDLIEMSGYLVEVTSDKFAEPWRSSLSRTDHATIFASTGCEIMWVDELTHIKFTNK